MGNMNGKCSLILIKSMWNYPRNLSAVGTGREGQKQVLGEPMTAMTRRLPERLCRGRHPAATKAYDCGLLSGSKAIRKEMAAPL